jgi:hypothetical protein
LQEKKEEKRKKKKKKGPFGQNSYEFLKIQKYDQGGSGGLLN